LEGEQINRKYSTHIRPISALNRLAFLVVFVLAGCGGENPARAVQQQSALRTQVVIPVTGAGESTSLPPASTPVIEVTSQPVGVIPNGCQSPAVLTPALTEGPFFKANSPERSSLLTEGVTGTRLILIGFVLTQDCKPVAHALLDFWQANAKGQYDNAGYSLRGHQFTGEDGRYRLDTVVPGLYPGRTEHIHVKVQALGGQILTTQLFFPGVHDNESDTIFNRALMINLQEGSKTSIQGTFNFIIAAQ
jgi:protocatechuate 3,4-dioxygenase beta subunit